VATNEIRSSHPASHARVDKAEPFTTWRGAPAERLIDSLDLTGTHSGHLAYPHYAGGRICYSCGLDVCSPRHCSLVKNLFLSLMYSCLACRKLVGLKVAFRFPSVLKKLKGDILVLWGNGTRQPLETFAKTVRRIGCQLAVSNTCAKRRFPPSSFIISPNSVTRTKYCFSLR
jgi:hypothetical protein